ncbi:alkaline phosphatase family protein [Cryobacterium sp. PH31-AA6]|uniref:alkaline phosphatase family protein n=1 Tax=Cryobacterium sp. PH31-AA6 TaxID=3046205 RepID=UPI0024B99091|nr:alkaline phosphatase family protein [Cryobacterium sp. PH31-AA6]MDJ0322651.1 alkaline phosphatase family protein [Cryobacterium sp. PH31-AA6]
MRAPADADHQCCGGCQPECAGARDDQDRYARSERVAGRCAGEEPPGTGEKGEIGFAFDRLGPRVPAILISAYTARNTIVNETKHHGSLIATLTRQHGLEPLTHRDAEGPDMFDAINRTSARPLAEWTITQAAYVPADIDGEMDPKAEQNKAKKLSNPATGLLGLLITKFGNSADPVPDSYEDAFNALTELGQGLFGTLNP